MQIDVFMADKRTMHRLERRGDLKKLVERDADQLDGFAPVECWTRRHPEAELVFGHLMFLRRDAIDEVAVAAVAGEPAG